MRDIDPSTESPPRRLTDIEGTLFFSADDGIHGYELWKSDGSPAGTVMVEDIWPGQDGSLYYYANANRLIDAGGTLLFSADDGTHGQELWRSDGTVVGTSLVKDIWPGPVWGFPYSSTDVEGTLYFQADDAPHGWELWQSDGTSAGTVLVRDIWPGPKSSDPYLLTNVEGTLYFRTDDGAHGRELWKSDGTAAGTVMVTDIWPGSVGSRPKYLVYVPE